ncbi:MAG: dihydropteroate synthase [Candidatus Gastranaerophilales bacterium]|nr:dihydropteroate synthase [Candidatus Gastranaerophilales bacterium]
MDNFVLKDVNTVDLEKELEQVGFDKTYLNKAVEKFRYKNIKIFDLTVPQANVLKQTAISVGADCAVHRETITSKIEKTDCILGGSFSQLRQISQKLSRQPFKLSKLANLIEQDLDFKLMPIQIKESVFDFSRPYIVGVLNITQNSFSDGGEFFEFEDTAKHLLEMIEAGADIIELGAESTKPFSSAVPANKQLEKLLPVLEFIREKGIKIPISIDTRSCEVAKKCVEAGADIINDVSGLEYEADMAKTLSQLNVPVIIQHSKGTPENMQINPVYENLLDEIFLDLKNKTNFAVESGIKPENIIIDPGIGFGKTKEQNFEIIKRIDEFSSLGYPVMLGISRKSLLDMPQASNEEKDIFTLALNSRIIKKVNFIRVHNVKLHKRLLFFNQNSEI